MARIETVTRTLYQFDELSDDAKERARNRYRGLIESDELSDYDDWQAIAAIFGVEFDTRRTGEPKVWWSGFSSQGDGASWEGWYSYSKGASARIRQYAPQDERLHAIADTLQAVQRRNFYRMQASVTQSGRYVHEMTMRFDVSRTDDIDVSESDEETLCEALRDFARWIYRQLETQWDYLHSDECVDESIRANEYEFTAEGEIA